MNIDEMTYGELKAIAAMFQKAETPTAHPFVGKYVIARCYHAGVHAGTLVSSNGDQAILSNSRRLWQWKAKQGIALSGVAQYGVIAGSSKLDVIIPEIALIGVCEIIPCSAKAKESINE
jgi:hypothetical protein